MIRPLGENILVDRIESENTTPGGIILVENAKQLPCEGVVIATGLGKMTKHGETVAMECKVGDKVLFSKYAGSTFKFDGKEYLMMKDSEVLAIRE